MKIKFIIVPGNYKGDGIWEGEVSAKDMNNDQVQFILCEHNETKSINHQGQPICIRCGAEEINGIWRKKNEKDKT